MAFIVKNRQTPYRVGSPVIRDWRHSRCAAYSPTAATVAKFTVSGGAILVHLMYGTIVTTLEATASNVSVTLNPTTGTTGTVASTAEGNGLVAGDHILIEGDGTAAIVAGATKWFTLGGPAAFIADAGAIEVIHAAAQTGTLRWDLFWEPLDEEARVVAN